MLSPERMSPDGPLLSRHQGLQEYSMSLNPEKSWHLCTSVSLVLKAMCFLGLFLVLKSEISVCVDTMIRNASGNGLRL